MVIRFGLFFLFSLLMTTIYNVYPGPMFCVALLNTHTDAEPRVLGSSPAPSLQDSVLMGRQTELQLGTFPAPDPEHVLSSHTL